MSSAGAVPPPHVAGPLRLLPFRALRLAPSRVGDPASARAFARPYKDVAERLARWQERGLLQRDADPALYVHEYTVSGITVRGLVGALDVSRRALRPEDRAILPHEGIYPTQADELADRMGDMALNPAPILLVHRAPPELRRLLGVVRAQAPEHQFLDRAGHAHRLWAIRDPDDLEAIAEALAPCRALIADGHHRYAAYLRLQQRRPGPATALGLAMLVDQDDTPLFLGAIHRVLIGSTLDDLRAAASSLDISVREVDAESAVAALDPTTLVATDGQKWLVVPLVVPPDRAPVEILHEQLVPALPHGPSRISFHHTVDDALARTHPEHGTAILMPAPDLDRVYAIALADRLLPEKATSFQPKPAFGVLVRTLRDE